MKAWILAAMVLGWAPASGAAQGYPKMAAVEEYRMERGAEIVLARSAAPESISKDAGVMVMGARGYETVSKGTNGFVCVVLRSWTAGIDDPEFWNPKTRGPVCVNPAAARTYLRVVARKTELVLAGRSKEQIVAEVKRDFEKKELLPVEPGAMSYMMSKQGYLNNADGPWHPHLMLFVPLTEEKTWGAGLAGVPVYAAPVPEDRMTVLMIPVAKWSDGTAYGAGSSK